MFEADEWDFPHPLTALSAPFFAYCGVCGYCEDKIMSEKSTLKCPNCQKELIWIPKGKHLCRCGEIISSTGEDLEQFNLSKYKIPLKDKLTSLVEFQIILPALLIIGLLITTIFYQKEWHQYEAEFIANTFGIDTVPYKELIFHIIIGLFLMFWIVYRIQ